MKTTLVILASVLLIASVMSVAYAASSDSANADAKVTVNTFVDISLTDNGATANINFGSADPGQEKAETEQTSGTGAITVTVEATTNTPVDISTSGTAFSGPGAQTIGIGQVTESTTNLKSGGSAMSSTPGVLIIDLGGTGSAASQDVWYWLDVPSPFLTAGQYTSTFSYSAA